MRIFAIKGTRKRRAAFIANKNLRKRTRLKCGLLQQVRGKLFKGHAYISRRRCSCTSRPRKNMRAFAHAPVSRHRNVPVRVYCLCLSLFVPVLAQLVHKLYLFDYVKFYDIIGNNQELRV